MGRREGMIDGRDAVSLKSTVLPRPQDFTALMAAFRIAMFFKCAL
jgi:hypothetical protein